MTEDSIPRPVALKNPARTTAGKHSGQNDQQRRNAQCDLHGMAVDAPLGVNIRLAVHLAGIGLKPLRHAVEQSRTDESRIGNHTVSRHRDVSRQAEQDEVEHHRRDAAGHLAHKRHNAETARAHKSADGRRPPHKADVIGRREKVHRAC